MYLNCVIGNTQWGIYFHFYNLSMWPIILNLSVNNMASRDTLVIPKEVYTTHKWKKGAKHSATTTEPGIQFQEAVCQHNCQGWEAGERSWPCNKSFLLVGRAACTKMVWIYSCVAFSNIRKSISLSLSTIVGNAESFSLALTELSTHFLPKVKIFHQSQFWQSTMLPAKAANLSLVFEWF